MRSLEELTDTTTTTAGIADITPEIWAKEIEESAQALRVARNFIKINTDLKSGPGDIVHLPKSGSITATGLTDGTDITTTAMTGYSTLDLTPSEVGAGVSITRNVVENVMVDILKDATRQLSEALAQKEDVDIYAAMDVAGPTILYAGTATDVSTLTAGDVIDLDLFANALTQVRVGKYRPDVLFVHPTQENVFLKESQFVNASEYGSDKVVQNGEIGTYLGVKIVVSTNLPGYAAGTVDPADGATWAVNGHTAIMVDSKHAAAIALKRDPSVETNYEPKRRMHEIYATMKYQAGVLNNGAICLVKVADA